MLLSLTVVSVSAESDFRGWFYTEYLKQHRQPTFYTELYYHYEVPNDTDSSNIDWALVFCTEDVMDSVTTWSICCVVGERVITVSNEFAPLEIPYALYDKKKNEFINLVDVNPDDYDGLMEAFGEVGIGRLIGDMDNDKTLSILDATMIQQALAGIIEFPKNDEVDASYAKGSESITYYSDFDRDGERTILDATEIQMKLAKVS